MVGRVFVLGTVFGVSGVDGFSGKRDPDAGFGLIAFWEGASMVVFSILVNTLEDTQAGSLKDSLLGILQGTLLNDKVLRLVDSCC